MGDMTVHGGRRLAIWLMIPGVCLYLAYRLLLWLPLLCVGTGLILAGIIVWVIFWRCPGCRKFLGREDVNYCPHYGRALGERE